VTSGYELAKPNLPFVFTGDGVCLDYLTDETALCCRLEGPGLLPLPWKLPVRSVIYAQSGRISPALCKLILFLRNSRH
jgi:hypothetical protein